MCIILKYRECETEEGLYNILQKLAGLSYSYKISRINHSFEYLAEDKSISMLLKAVVGLALGHVGLDKLAPYLVFTGNTPQ